jgi:hypothetical protein
VAPELLHAAGVRTTGANGRVPGAIAAATAFLIAVGTPGGPARAAEPAPNQVVAGVRDLSVHAGFGWYTFVGGSASVIAGPKLAFDGGFALGPHVWLDFGLGLVFGGCLIRRGDEGDCVVKPGQVVEPVIGIKVKTPPVSRFLGYARVVAGGVSVSADGHGSSGGAIVRGGAGIKGFGNGPVAFGVEASVVGGTGSFKINYGSPAATLVGFDLLLGVEIRF